MLRLDVANKILEILKSAGFESYLCGSFALSRNVGSKSSFKDISTTASISEIKKLLKDSFVLEKERRRYIVYSYDNLNVKISCNLIDSKAPFNFDEITQINNELLDGEISVINKNIILQKPVEILRCILISSLHDIPISKESLRFFSENNHLLDQIFPKKIFSYLRRIIVCDNAGDIIVRHFDIFKRILPQLAPLENYNQNNKHHIYDCLVHTAHVINYTEPDLALRLAALFHDAGKPHCYTVDSDGAGHFYGHAKISAEITRETLYHFGAQRELVRDVFLLVRYHSQRIEPDFDYIKKRLSYLSPQLYKKLLKLCIADNRSKNPNYTRRLIRATDAMKIIDDIIISGEEISSYQLDITREELSDAGFLDSTISEVLSYLLALVIDGKIENCNKIILENALKYKDSLDNGIK